MHKWKKQMNDRSSQLLHLDPVFQAIRCAEEVVEHFHRSEKYFCRAYLGKVLCGLPKALGMPSIVLCTFPF